MVAMWPLLTGLGTVLVVACPFTFRRALRDRGYESGLSLSMVVGLSLVVAGAICLIVSEFMWFTPGEHTFWFFMAGGQLAVIVAYIIYLHRSKIDFSDGAVIIVAAAMLFSLGMTVYKAFDPNSYRLTSGIVVGQGSTPPMYIPMTCSNNVCTGGYYEPPTWEITIRGSYDGKSVTGTLTFYSDVLPEYPIGSHYP